MRRTPRNQNRRNQERRHGPFGPRPRAVLCLLMIYGITLLAGCGGSAKEQESIARLRDLGALVVLDVNQHASSLVLPGDAEKIELAMPLLTHLPHLTSFGAINTPITDDALQTVGRLKSLTNVDVSDTNISDAGVKHLVGLSKLSSLNLASTQVTSAGLEDVGRLKGVEMLNLANTNTSGGFQHLSGCRDLTWLVLSHMTLSDADARALANHPNLKRLTASTAVELSEQANSVLQAKGILVDLSSSGAADPPAVEPAP